MEFSWCSGPGFLGSGVHPCLSPGGQSGGILGRRMLTPRSCVTNSLIVKQGAYFLTSCYMFWRKLPDGRWKFLNKPRLTQFLSRIWSLNDGITTLWPIGSSGAFHEKNQHTPEHTPLTPKWQGHHLINCWGFGLWGWKKAEMHAFCEPENLSIHRSPRSYSVRFWAFCTLSVKASFIICHRRIANKNWSPIGSYAEGSLRKGRVFRR